MYHFRPPRWQWEQGYNLRLNPVAQVLALNFNLHGVHHGNLQLRWYELPEAFEKQRGGRYDGGYLSAAFRQLLGPAVYPREVVEAMQASERVSDAEKARVAAALDTR